MCVKELTKAPVSSLKLIGVFLFLMSMFSIHLIDLVNFLCDTFNEQTVASLVRVVTDLVHLLFSCFAHIWWSGLLSSTLAMFSPQMSMNPLSETLHMYHMHIAGILLRVDLGRPLCILDLLRHCVQLTHSPPLTSFVTLTFHMFDQCVWPCPGSSLFLDWVIFSQILRVCSKKQFVGFLEGRIPHL